MNIQEIFRSQKNDVVRLWTEAVYSTYPFETTGFLRTKRDPFGNPVAHMTREAAGTLYDAVAGEEVEIDTVKAALERFVKLRAVQTFTPSQGLGVFYLMKPLLRERILLGLTPISRPNPGWTAWRCWHLTSTPRPVKHWRSRASRKSATSTPNWRAGRKGWRKARPARADAHGEAACAEARRTLRP